MWNGFSWSILAARLRCIKQLGSQLSNNIFNFLWLEAKADLPSTPQALWHWEDGQKNARGEAKVAPVPVWRLADQIAEIYLPWQLIRKQDQTNPVSTNFLWVEPANSTIILQRRGLNQPPSVQCNYCLVSVIVSPCRGACVCTGFQ